MRMMIITAVLGLLGLGAFWGTTGALETTTAAVAEAAPPPPQHRDSQAVRHELMRAANRLENSPCDQSLRAPLHDAIVAYRDDIHESLKYPDLDAAEIMIDALLAGVIGNGDVASIDTSLGAVSMRYGDGTHRVIITGHGRFACDIGGIKENDRRYRPRYAK